MHREIDTIQAQIPSPYGYEEIDTDVEAPSVSFRLNVAPDQAVRGGGSTRDLHHKIHEVRRTPPIPTPLSIVTTLALPAECSVLIR